MSSGVEDTPLLAGTAADAVRLILLNDALELGSAAVRARLLFLLSYEDGMRVLLISVRRRRLGRRKRLAAFCHRRVVARTLLRRTARRRQRLWRWAGSVGSHVKRWIVDLGREATVRSG